VTQDDGDTGIDDWGLVNDYAVGWTTHATDL